MGRIASEGTEEGFADAALLSEMRAGNSTAFAAFESGGNRYVRPTATAPHLDSTSGGNRAVALECQLSPNKPTMRQVKSTDSPTPMPTAAVLPTNVVRGIRVSPPRLLASGTFELRASPLGSALGSSGGSAHLGSKPHRFRRWGLVAGAEWIVGERRRLRRQDFERPLQVLWRRRGEAAARR